MPKSKRTGCIPFGIYLALLLAIAAAAYSLTSTASKEDSNNPDDVALNGANELDLGDETISNFQTQDNAPDPNAVAVAPEVNTINSVDDIYGDTLNNESSQ